MSKIRFLIGVILLLSLAVVSSAATVSIGIGIEIVQPLEVKTMSTLIDLGSHNEEDIGKVLENTEISVAGSSGERVDISMKPNIELTHTSLSSEGEYVGYVIVTANYQ